MLNYVFSTSLYWKFKAENYEALNSYIDSLELTDDKDFAWGFNCRSKKRDVEQKDLVELLYPNLLKLSDIIGRTLDISLTESWLNFYEKGDFQEVHSHSNRDLVMIYFPKVKSDYSKFYLYDRNEHMFAPELAMILGYKNIYYPKIMSGDIMFFPGNMLHAVTPHNSDEIRKTLSANFHVQIPDVESLGMT